KLTKLFTQLFNRLFVYLSVSNLPQVIFMGAAIFALFSAVLSLTESINYVLAGMANYGFIESLRVLIYIVLAFSLILKMWRISITSFTLIILFGLAISTGLSNGWGSTSVQLGYALSSGFKGLALILIGGIAGGVLRCLYWIYNRWLKRY
ncbi:hypothetical protein CGH27_23800, partial [Vibrio parahaemolyticus]|uniref:hypothetical protein n=2 Tax=Vibrio TaxID=662 RepID=UPI00116CF02D